MNSLYILVSDYEIAEILTIISFGLLCLAWLSFIYGNAKKLNKRLTSFQWAQTYILGVICFLAGVILLGKLIVPKNADGLLELLHIDRLLNVMTLKFQQLLLSLIRPLI